MSRGTIAALAVGIALGLATLDIGNIDPMSANHVIAALQEGLFCLLVPGLIGSMAAWGNVHAFSLWVGAVINAAVYFGLVKLIVWMAMRWRQAIAE